MGNDWVEVKTISPEKLGEATHVKRAGNFNKVLVIKIGEDFDFQAKMIDRKLLGKGKGKRAKVVWGQHASPVIKNPGAASAPGSQHVNASTGIAQDCR